jgi:thiol:disulfide interchange protein
MKRLEGITIMLTTSWKALVGVIAIASATVSQAADKSYDPEADVFEQYQNAIAQAQAQNKLVLVVAGGEWCHWCNVLNKFVTRNDEVEAALNDTFVVVKAYVGEKNFNELFFSQLPQAKGVPHFWVISPARDVLASQSTKPFELAQKKRLGYNKDAFLQFIAQWKQRNAQLQPVAISPAS